MPLLTKALRKQLPPLYATEQEADPLVLCKFFYPSHPWRWYATEFDGQDISLAGSMVPAQNLATFACPS